MHSPCPPTTTQTAVGNAAHAVSVIQVPDSSSVRENVSVAKPGGTVGVAVCARATPGSTPSVQAVQSTLKIALRNTLRHTGANSIPNWRMAYPVVPGRVPTQSYHANPVATATGRSNDRELLCPRRRADTRRVALTRRLAMTG